MDLQQFNPDTYEVTDVITGEVIPVNLFVEHCSKDYWEKAYARTLAEFIGVFGTGKISVLAYLIKERNEQNLILGTTRSIAKECNTHFSTVQSIFTLLQKKDYLKKVRNGCYFLSPKIIRHGNTVHGAMLLRIWDSSTETTDHKTLDVSGIKENRDTQEIKKNTKRKNKMATLPKILPVNLNQEKLIEFMQHRKEIGKPFKEQGLTSVIKKLSGMQNEDQILIIDDSIANGYQGLFFNKTKSRQNDTERNSKKRSESINDLSHFID